MKHLRVLRDTGLHKSRVVLILIGPGAGYIGGRTIFWSAHCNRVNYAGRPSRFWTCRIGPYYFGYTRNANVVPWCTH